MRYRALLGLWVAASADAQPRFELGGEAAMSFRVLWEGQSTADGFDAHAMPAVTGQLGGAWYGPFGAALALDWSTFGVSDGEGTASVSARHHLVGIGPHVFWMDGIWRAGALIEALVDRVSTTNRLDGVGSQSASGVHAGFRYGLESSVRFGTVPLTFSMHVGGQHRDARDDLLLGISLGWIWGAMAPEAGREDGFQSEDPAPLAPPDDPGLDSDPPASHSAELFF